MERRRKRDEAKTSYKELTKRIKLIDRDETAKVQGFIEDSLATSAELYNVVKKKLDGTVCDSRFMRDVTELAKETSKRINANCRAFDLKRIILRLKREQSDLARHVATDHVKTFLCTAPTFEYFYGALAVEDLVIEKRKKRIREKIVETQAVTSKQKTEVDDEPEESTTKEVEYINEQVGRLASSIKGAPFFDTIVDPKSFTRTVENIFHLSFLVKEGKIGVEPDEKRKAKLTKPNDSTKGEGNQSILSFTMKDYQDWLEFFDIKQRAFPPRNKDD